MNPDVNFADPPCMALAVPTVQIVIIDMAMEASVGGAVHQCLAPGVPMALPGTTSAEVYLCARVWARADI